jgi:hypothetical protein
LHEDVEEIKAHRLAVAARLGDDGDGRPTKRNSRWCDGVSPLCFLPWRGGKEKGEGAGESGGAVWIQR